MKNAFALLCMVVLVGCQDTGSRETPPEFDVEIRWTSYGIPHVKADNWGSLGYGFAYATATDAFCVIAHEVMLVAGEQSRHQGPEAGRLESDIFHKALLDTKVLDNFTSVLDNDSADFKKTQRLQLIQILRPYV